MVTYEKRGWYEMELPDHWMVDEEEEPNVFYDPDGAGAVHIAVQQPRQPKPGERLDVFLFMRAFLTQTGIKFDENNARKFGKKALEGAAYDFTTQGPEGPLVERLWFLTNQDFLLFVTYTCRYEDRDKERDVLDKIIKSIKLIK